MITKILKTYTKHWVLLLVLALNISVSFTSDGIKIDVNKVMAQMPEGDWDTGYDWLDDFLDVYGFEQGVYMNLGDGNWSYCPDCAAHVNLEEIIVYGTNMSSAPIDLSMSDLWYSEPILTGNQWSYYDYIGQQWVHVPGETSNDPEEQSTRVEQYTLALESLVGKTYTFGANGPDAYDCSSAVCFGVRQIVIGFGDYSAHSLYGMTNATSSRERGILVFYDWTSDGIIDHVTTLTGDGMMIHPSSGAGEILWVSESYLDSYLNQNGGTKYYHKIDWNSLSFI